MDVSLGLSIAALIFAFLAFVTSVGTLTYLLARRFSTHETQFVPAGETQHYFPNPPAWARDPAADPNDTPGPLTLTEEEYQRRQRLAAMEREDEEYAAGLEI